MRWRIWLSVLGVVAAGSTASAQFPGQSASPFTGGGIPVGRAMLQPVGQTFAPAAQPVGQPVGRQVGILGPNGQPVTQQRPEGQMIDLRNLVAPLSAPLPPGLENPNSPGLIDQFYERWRSLIGLSRAPVSGPSPNYTPGLSRRNRERRQNQAWWRD